MCSKRVEASKDLNNVNEIFFKSYKRCLVDVLKPFSAIHTKWGVEQNILIQATGGHVIGKKTIQFVLHDGNVMGFYDNGSYFK